jgi:hypothetical protein
MFKEVWFELVCDFGMILLVKVQPLKTSGWTQFKLKPGNVVKKRLVDASVYITLKMHQIYFRL